MKKLLLAISALILGLTVVSCGPAKNENVEGKVNFVGITDDNLETDYTYNDDYFLTSAPTLNNNLADVSLALALTGAKAPGDNPMAYMEGFYNACKFTNVVANEDFAKTPTENTIGFAMASKEINVNGNKYLLVSTNVRGFTYGAEWVSNFELGESGNHQGFDKASDKVLAGIVDYVKKYNTNNLKLKYWLTGYSRAGAVAGLTASKLTDQNREETNNIYAYTFEAPASRVSDKKYENIFNYVNPDDLVTKIIPSSFNLVRPGVDIDYTTRKDFDKMASYVAKLTKNVTLKKYSAEKPMSTLITDLFKAIFGDDGAFRKTYVTEYQSSIQFLINKVFSLTSAERTKLIDYFKSNLLSMVSVISGKNKDRLKSLVINALNSANVEYDSTQMNNALDKIANLVVDVFLNNVSGDDLAALLVNINSIIQNHYCEVSLAYMRTKYTLQDTTK